MKLIVRLWRAKRIVNWRWDAAERNESIKSGMPKSQPKPKKSP